MTLAILRTGVVIREATAEETSAIARARAGGKFDLGSPRSYSLMFRPDPPSDDETYIVGQTFVEYSVAGETGRWVASEHHGAVVSLRDDETLALLALARDVAEDRIDLLADLRIADVGVSRWQIMGAPFHIELDPELEKRLAPLRRG